ncbi:MAG: AAA family ATPase [Firmicutes bacterium]|nr:AAA family ATPase [Bacillota bacterium]
MKREITLTLEEEAKNLSEIQEMIQSQMNDRLKELGLLKQEIVEGRKFQFEEVQLKNRFQFSQSDPVKEAYYQSTYERVLQLSKMYYSPYFGMIDYLDKVLDGEEFMYYIGRAGLSVGGEPVILDWRTPAASLFYQQRLGEMMFRAPSGNREVDLKHRRQYIIKKGELKGMFDSEIDIKDDILQMVLSGSSGSRLKDVISTIQKEQDDIIREPLESNVILNGVAGCGKTTIVLHRIAYLLYNYRKQLNNNVLIIGPNALFMDYISEVLPDLGEKDTSFQFTVKELATRLVRPKRQCMRTRDYYERMLTGRDKRFMRQAQYKSSLTFKADLDKAFKEFEEAQRATEDLIFQSQVVMSAEERNQMFFKTQTRLPYIRRCDKIKRTIRARVRDIRNDTLRRLRLAYRAKIQEAKRKGDYYLANDLELERADVLHKYFQEVYTFIKSIRTLYDIPDTEEWYARTIGADEDTIWTEDDLVGLLYVKSKIEGKGVYPIKHLVIDEAQDISIFGFFVLRAVTGADSYTVVGDRRQKIKGGAHNSMMDYWEKVLSKDEREKIKYYEMDLSYRSTRQIIDYSRSLLKFDNQMRAVDRNGEPVRHLTFTNPMTLGSMIIQEAKAMEDAGMERTAILCQTIAEAKTLHSLIKSQIDCRLVATEKDPTDSQLLIMPVYFAKGLEFDGVIAVEANKPKEDGLLSYILCTRALHRLTHITAGDLIFD